MDSKRRRRLVLALGLFLAGPPIPAPARAQGLRPAAADLTLGPATSWGGNHDYAYRRTASLTFDWAPEHRGPVVWGMTAGLRPQLAGSFDLVCRIQPDGSCAQPVAFPWLIPFGVFAGLEAIGPASEYRATGGPMLYAGGIAAWGGRAQFTAAGGSSTLKLVGALRVDLLRHGRETVRLGSVEAGVRLF